MCDALRKGWWGGNWGDLFTYKKREKSIARKIKEIVTVLKEKRKRKEKQNRGNKRQKSDMKKKYIFANIIIGNIRKMNFQRLLILWKIIKYTYATTQFEKNHCSTCQFLHAHTTSFTFFSVTTSTSNSFYFYRKWVVIFFVTYKKNSPNIKIWESQKKNTEISLGNNNSRTAISATFFTSQYDRRVIYIYIYVYK